MVSLTNKKLTQKEVFRGVLWTFEDEWKKQKEIEAEVIAELPDLKDWEVRFEVSKRLAVYRASQPSMKERQIIWDKLYPVKSYYVPIFTEEELFYIQERLHGSNDGIGLSILEKISKYFADRS